jgi:lysozyme
MAPSPRILAFVQGFERLRLVGYLPTKKDRPTIGWGHTGPEVKVGMVWTREQADETFAADTAIFARGLEKELWGVPTTQGQYDALFSLAYNIGLAALKTSHLIRYHKLGLYQKAANAFLDWDHQAGAIVDGLLKRRKAERLIYLS